MPAICEHTKHYSHYGAGEDSGDNPAGQPTLSDLLYPMNTAWLYNDTLNSVR